MKFSEYEQGTEEWLEDRKKRVTASDASIINGTNKFRGNTPFELYRKKHGLAEPEKQSFAMWEGSNLEEEALVRFNHDHDTNFNKPPGGYHDEHEWMMASLDGYDEEDKEHILEIKCGAATYDKALKGEIPPYYYDQVQHQLFVSDRKICYYMAYRPEEEPVVINIKRDETYFEAVFEKEKIFYDDLKNCKAPALEEKDFFKNEDKAREEKAAIWKSYKEMLKQVAVDEKRSKEELLNETDDGNTLFATAGVKVERRVKTGNLDYKVLIKDFNALIDEYELILAKMGVFEEANLKRPVIEDYRKPESSWSQPVIIKQA